MKHAAGALLQSIEIDRRSRRSLSTQLYVGLRELILSGGMSAGERLPATRTLARDLGLSRTIVVAAFERLMSEELLEARVGAGTFVSAVLARGRRPENVRKSATRKAARLSKVMLTAATQFSKRERLPYEPCAFTTAVPAFDAFPLAQWARLSAKYWRGNRHDVMGYGEPFGHRDLRSAIAAHLRTNRGITCDADQIFIVGGAQQAFHLIGTMLLDPGDKVWFENPGAIGARNSLVACGAEIVPVPIDGSGLRVDQGLALAPDFRLAFVTPSHQQPLGVVMSLERRIALLDAARNAGAWIIEDDYDGEFFFGGRPPATLKSFDTAGHVIYVGTFSKSLFPSLRLGFMLAPPPLVQTLQRLMTTFLPGVPSSLQAIVANFIDEGHFNTHIRRMRRLYAERHEALCQFAGAHLTGLLNVLPTTGGLHTIGLLQGDLAEMDVAAAAGDRNVRVSPISRFAVGQSVSRGLVLGFGGVRPAEIEVGVRSLAAALDGLVKPRPQWRLEGAQR